MLAFCAPMATDSGSTVRLLSARDGQKVLDISVSLVGATAVFNKGIAAFEVAVKPAFASVDENLFRATLLRQPFLYAEGTDTVANVNMQSSDVHQVFLAENRSVCQPGHVLGLDDAGSRAGPGACVKCPQTTYSSHPLLEGLDGSCSPCPPGMVCGGGQDAKPLEGFWVNPHLVHENPESVDMYDAQIVSTAARRSTPASEVTAHRCAAGACLSDWKCAEGHYGRACGICNSTRVNGKYFAMGAQGCVPCEETNVVVGAVVLTFCGIIATIVYYVAVWRPWIRFVAVEETLGSWFQSIRRRLRSFLHRSTDSENSSGGTTGYLKIMVGFFQVTAAFLSNLEVEWGTSLEHILSIFALFQLDFFTLPSTECVTSDIQHSKKLVVSTLAPVVVLVLLALPTFAVKIFFRNTPTEKIEAVSSAFSFAALAFLFLVYPFVSKAVLGTFNCADLRPDGGRWLKSDMRLTCPLESSNFALNWSIAFTIVFPFGVPALFLCMLYYFKVPQLAENKVKMHRLRAVLSRMNVRMDSPEGWTGTEEPVDFISVSQCNDILQFDFVAQERPENAEGVITDNLLRSASIERLSGAIELNDTAVEVSDQPDKCRAQTAALIETLCSSEIVVVPPIAWDGESGDNEKKAIRTCGFLFSTYEVQCWWCVLKPKPHLRAEPSSH